MHEAHLKSFVFEILFIGDYSSAFIVRPFEIFFNFDFQMHKAHLKSFVFEILFIGDYSSAFYLFDGKA